MIIIINNIVIIVYNILRLDTNIIKYYEIKKLKITFNIYFMIKRIRAITVTIIKEPRDLFTKNNTEIGNSFVINKKKFPYLIKFGWIKVRLTDGTWLLFYKDEIEIKIEGKQERRK